MNGYSFNLTFLEQCKSSSIQGTYSGSEKGNASGVDDDKVAGGAPGPGQPPGSMGFFLPPYASYANGGSKFGMVQPPYPSLMMYNEFAQPPPAHMGIPPVHTDPKTGLPRPPMYAAYPPHSQFPHPLYGPDFPQVPWHRSAGYPITTGAFSGSLPPSLSISRYGHPTLLPPGIPHPGMAHPGMLPGHKSEMMGAAGMQDRLEAPEERSASKRAAEEKKKNYVKKPLNAFMLFMKEMRPKVIAECTLRESSAINQILGRKWHALDRSEQAKYYDMARKEKDLHMQLYPGWSARDNYAMHQKKKKRKKTESSLMQENKTIAAECPNAKKCRARYGMEQQSQWCKPCRRKKKCIRYLREDGASSDEDCDESSSRMGSHQSNCDTDSTHDMDVDSPQPDRHLSFSQQHSPLSPIIQREEEVGVDLTNKMDLPFPVTSSVPSFHSSTLSMDPSAPSLPSPSAVSTPVKVKNEQAALSLTMSSPGLAST
ncbi:transcription factor 7-like 2 isoform X2 [Babylonia areolata]|uniref:transcription factor 7-like 2 isoform X2 n=1 Tax=Babylonia areolata TaxID=304850 RepID=UPI003FD3FC0A